MFPKQALLDKIVNIFSEKYLHCFYLEVQSPMQMPIYREYPQMISCYRSGSFTPFAFSWFISFWPHFFLFKEYCFAGRSHQKTGIFGNFPHCTEMCEKSKSIIFLNFKKLKKRNKKHKSFSRPACPWMAPALLIHPFIIAPAQS